MVFTVCVLCLVCTYDHRLPNLQHIYSVQCDCKHYLYSYCDMSTHRDTSISVSQCLFAWGRSKNEMSHFLFAWLYTSLKLFPGIPYIPPLDCLQSKARGRKGLSIRLIDKMAVKVFRFPNVQCILTFSSVPQLLFAWGRSKGNVVWELVNVTMKHWLGILESVKAISSRL